VAAPFPTKGCPSVAAALVITPGQAMDTNEPCAALREGAYDDDDCLPAADCLSGGGSDSPDTSALELYCRGLFDCDWPLRIAPLLAAGWREGTPSCCHLAPYVARRKRGNPTPSAEHGDGLKQCTLRREHALCHFGGGWILKMRQWRSNWQGGEDRL
jgi:hypothetical protein